MLFRNVINPRRTGTPKFPSPMGGGVFEHPPFILAAIGRREKAFESS